jgi:uncharacterized membrane protein YsdA (DUF1294 family)
MYEFVYNAYITINAIAFVIALLDKIACGALSGLFWLAAKCFGGAGVTAACMIFRHRTRSGAVLKTAFYAVVQLLIMGVLSKILQ